LSWPLPYSWHSPDLIEVGKPFDALAARPLACAIDDAAQGFRLVYHDDHANPCPGCGMSQWLVGRVSAQCAFCATALPLEHSALAGLSTAKNFWKHDMMRRGHFDGYSHRSDWDQQAIWER
jgi:hypothetical protein